MKNWQKIWWNIKDTATDKIEEFVNVFWRDVKHTFTLDRLIILVITVLLAVGAILSNLIGVEETKDHAAPPEKPPASQEQAAPETHDPVVEGEPAIEGVSIEEEKQMVTTGTAFVQEYTTYQDWDLKDRTERIKPFVTQEVYSAEKEASQDVPKEIPAASRFIKVEAARIEGREIGGAAQKDRPIKTYWVGTVVSVQSIAGKNHQIEERVQLTLVPSGDGWRIAEVVYL